MTANGVALCLALTLSWGCGVAGAPMPPGPLPPAAPDVRIINTPDGLELYSASPPRDIDGKRIDEPVELRLFPGTGPVTGPPVARATAQPIRLGRRPSVSTGRLVAYRGRRASRPSSPIRLRWKAPPPAPTPIGFVDAGGQARLMWPPLPAEVTEVVVLRDSDPVRTLSADVSTFTERPTRPRHRYQIIIRGETFRSGPSEAVTVTSHPVP